MSDTIIRVENLSKRYRIGGSQGHFKYGSLRDSLANTAKAPFRRLRSSSDSENKNPGYIWALEDVSFEVKQGDVLGIIGRNGAGKTTLLKILSRITKPTEGFVRLRGRVGSLLEVGTGFHPELTGRENIYLNGAVLGMKRVEIDRKFDEIVDFAEIEQFLDTPVKHYSSGMYMRLAFAVAAHLEPEILLVDEVLAVGDSKFQKKCLGKMEQVAGEGRTILFVSHQMAAIQNLCTLCMLIEKGVNCEFGNTETVISIYQKDATAMTKTYLKERKDRRGNGNIHFLSFRLLNDQGDIINAVRSGEKTAFELHFENNLKSTLKNIQIAVGIDNQIGQRIALISNKINGQYIDLEQEIQSVKINLEKLQLLPGKYNVTLFADVNGEIADWIRDAAFFEVVSDDYYGSGKLPPESQGNLLLDYSFQY